MTIQLAIKLPDRSVQEMDRLVNAGRFANRTEAVRAAVDRMLEEIREEQITAAMAEGYRRIPQTEEEIAWAEESTRAMILAEPWP